jgi:hypothetical protein
MSILVRSLGLNISGYTLPEFEIHKNSYYQVNMPFIMESEEDLNLLSILLGEQDNPSIQIIKNKPLYSGNLNRHKTGILDFFRSNKVENRLIKYYKLDKKEVESLLRPLRIMVNLRWNRIPHFEKCLISFEAALACSSFVFYDSAGLDPDGRNKMFNHARKKCKNGNTVVHLLYPTLESEKKEEFITQIER